VTILAYVFGCKTPCGHAPPLPVVEIYEYDVPVPDLELSSLFFSNLSGFLSFFLRIYRHNLRLQVQAVGLQVEDEMRDIVRIMHNLLPRPNVIARHGQNIAGKEVMLSLWFCSARYPQNCLKQKFGTVKQKDLNSKRIGYG
jgi:hypothetical protein